MVDWPSKVWSAVSVWILLMQGWECGSVLLCWTHSSSSPACGAEVQWGVSLSLSFLGQCLCSGGAQVCAYLCNGTWICFKSLKTYVHVLEVNIKIWEVLGQGCIFHAQYFIDFTDYFWISPLSRPLLYGILSHFLHGGKEESTQNVFPKASLLNYPKQNFGKPLAERNQKGVCNVIFAELLPVTRFPRPWICL